MKYLQNLSQPRDEWLKNRKFLENNPEKIKTKGKPIYTKKWFKPTLKILYKIAQVTKIDKIGKYFAFKPIIKHKNITIKNLNSKFHNYKILHLSDLHIDSNPKLFFEIENLLNGIEVDIVLMTGDYRFLDKGDIKPSIEKTTNALKGIKHKDGIYGILGNHDDSSMVEEFEKNNINMLCNETIQIEKENEKLIIVGLDDIHRFLTPEAINIMEINGFNNPKTPKIILAHSPDLLPEAADLNYDLYLCGHTHGGQICLPGGIPILTHSSIPRRKCRGFWKQKNMHGHTSKGLGYSSLPLRFFCQPEANIITLKKP